MVLPVAKLGSLVLKTLCKPIASRLKKEAGLHPKFRQFIINFAQVNHRITTRLYGHSANVEIRPLNEEKAVQAAADLIGELFVFSVAGVVLIFEVQRSARSDARKEEKGKQEIEGLRQREENLALEVEQLKQKLSEVEQLARGQGLSGILKFRQGHAPEDSGSKSAALAS